MNTKGNIKGASHTNGAAVLGMVSSTLGVSIENARRELSGVITEIKEDKVSKAEFQNTLHVLQSKREKVLARIEHNRDFENEFEEMIGPFLKQYAHLCTDMGAINQEVNIKHTTAMEILRKNFDYHPAYKRWSDAFSPVPWKPE
eukprot:CAMPEP_0196600360 /NCGR_PEP_ID=MMETSP1081-20130531/95345_1 /TAXON_ID=36882 /ORGANISM="Pyramimonas amylifera, Strain CCMP720" /LENGTH=143 /DNA_ID=CAMNT_0041926193 /DNA_START=457 /DNA_END=888 /DNA_ORIENTATION=+